MSKKKRRIKPIQKVQETTPETIKKSINWSLMFLLFGGVICLILVIISRVNLLDIPLSRDEASYIYLGKLALNGFTPYVEFYEMKPPGLFYIYSLVGGIFGFNDIGVRIAVALSSIVVGYFCYLIVKKFTNKNVGIIAGIAYPILSLNMFAFGFAAVSEHFLNLLAIPGLYFLVSAENNKKRLILSGILLVLAVSIKQSAAVFILAGLVWLLFDHFSITGKKSKSLLMNLVWWAAGGLACASLFVLVLLLSGTFGDFYYWVIDYPTKYLSTVSWESGQRYLLKFGEQVFGAQKLLISVGGLGLLSSFFLLKSNKSFFVFLWSILIFSTLSIFPGFRFYGHYWLLMMPAVACLVSGLYFIIQKALKPAWTLTMLSIVFVMLFISEFVTNFSHYYFTKNHQFISYLTYSGNPFSEHQWLAGWLDDQMAPEDQIMVMGSEPQYYVYLDKIAPSRHFYHGILSKPNPDNDSRQKEAFDDLKKAMPEFLVINYYSYSWSLREDSNQYLYNRSFSFANNNYKTLAVMEVRPGDRPRFLTAEAAEFYKPLGLDHIIVYKFNR